MPYYSSKVGRTAHGIAARVRKVKATEGLEKGVDRGTEVLWPL